MRAAAIFLRRRLPEVVAAALPISWLVIRNGSFLVPSALDWLSWGDSTMHLGGWLFFSREPWSWPPARIASWLVPGGTTIGLADAIPLVALPLKVVAFEVGTPFQYFGLWFALCLGLQGVFASRLLAELGAGERLRALGGALAGFSPVVWQRFDCGHYSLTAQWLILACFLAWTRYFGSGGRLRNLLWLAACPALAASIHPYLALICGALLAAIVPATARFGARRTLVAAGVAIAAGAASALVGYLAGFLGTGATLRAAGWGTFSADLAAPFDPDGRSDFLRALVHSDSVSEGFAYLGVGVLVLAFIGLSAMTIRRLRAGAGSLASVTEDPHGLRMLWFACAVLALIAALPSFRIAGYEVMTASKVMAVLETALGPFRANGRLIWPVHALLLISVLRWLRPLASKPWLFTGLMAAAIAIQAAELGAGGSPGKSVMSPAASKLWKERYPGYLKLRMLPPYVSDGGRIYCGEVHGGDTWIIPAFLAATSGATFDSGYVTRQNEVSALATCAQGERVLEDLALEPDTVYFVRPSLARRVSSSGFECQRVLKTLWACIALQPDVRGAAEGAKAEGRAQAGR